MANALQSKRWLIVAAAAIAVCAAAFLLFRDDPQELYRRAGEIAAENPQKAEALLHRAIRGAEGDFPQAQLLLCRLLGDQGRWIEARGGFSLIRDPQTCDPQELLKLSDAALLADEWALPEMALSAAADRPDASPQVLRRLIELRLRLGQQQQALQDCRRLAELTPDDAFPWLAMAEIQDRRSRVTETIEAYRQALQRSIEKQREIAARSRYVELLIQFQDAPAARAQFDRLTADAPMSFELRLKQARLLRLEGDSQQALQLVEQAVRERPDSTAALMLQGVLQFDLAHYEQAVEALVKVVAAQPAAKEAHYKLAQAYRRLHRDQDAERHLQESARLNALSTQRLALQARLDSEPDNVELMRQLADVCQQTGRQQEAEHWRRLAAQSRR